MPIRLCVESGCPEPATYRGRCPEHARAENRRTHRNGRNRAVYNSVRWRNTRRKVLADNSLCTANGCQAIATDVHHRVDLSDGGDPFALSNLQALCAACHSKITRQRLSS